MDVSEGGGAGSSSASGVLVAAFVGEVGGAGGGELGLLSRFGYRRGGGHAGATGDEIFFVDPDDNIVAVPVRVTGALLVGAPAVLAQGSVFSPRRITWFEAAPDGQQFYVKLATDLRTLNVVMNWQGLVR